MLFFFSDEYELVDGNCFTGEYYQKKRTQTLLFQKNNNNKNIFCSLNCDIVVLQSVVYNLDIKREIDVRT